MALFVLLKTRAARFKKKTEKAKHMRNVTETQRHLLVQIETKVSLGPLVNIRSRVVACGATRPPRARQRRIYIRLESNRWQCTSYTFFRPRLRYKQLNIYHSPWHTNELSCYTNRRFRFNNFIVFSVLLHTPTILDNYLHWSVHKIYNNKPIKITQQYNINLFKNITFL